MSPNLVQSKLIGLWAIGSTLATIFFVPILLSGQVDVLGDKRYVIEYEEEEVVIPIFSSHVLTTTDSSIESVIVVVHGTLRNADDYFDHMVEARSMRPQKVDKIAIIAPQFLTKEDIESFQLEENYPYWSVNGWASGSTSRNEDGTINPLRVSSFEILDSLIADLPMVFPALKHLVFTGHSAGGRLTNRYCASSPIFDLLCDDFQISSKFIIANSNTFVYMTKERHVPGSAYQFDEMDTGCENFNNWSFGLDNLFVYPNRIGAARIREQYRSREVVYLLGSEDNDPDDLSSSCAGNAQGFNRFERGRTYYEHIIDVFGEDIRPLHRMIIVPGVGHDHRRMYLSEQGLSELFDMPPSSSCMNQTTSIVDPLSNGYTVYPNPATEYITLFDEDYSNREKSIVVFDVQGTRQLEISTRGNVSTVINLEKLDSGIYFIRINLGKATITKRFIKL